MTITTQGSKVNYQGNGVTTEFQVPFPFLEEEDIHIQKQLEDTTVVNLTYGTDYSVTGASNASGGVVVLATAPSASEVISVYRSVPLTQEVDYRENEIFPAETHEEALDKLTMEVQQLQEQADRAIRISRFSDADPETVVTQVERIYDSIDNVDIVADNISDISTVAANTSNVTTVAGSIDSVNNVAEIKDNVIAVDNNKANINTVAANVEDVVMVAGIKDAVTNVSDNMDAVVGVNNNKDNINAIYAFKDDIVTVSSIAEDVSKVSGIKENVTLVATDLDKVNIVADNISNVIFTGTNIDNVNNVGNDISNVNVVSSNVEDVNKVAAINNQVEAVGNNISSVVAVSDISTQVSTVASNAESIKTIGDNIDVVLKSPEYANNSKTWAEGDDISVGELGGVHSAKGWAEIASQVSQIDPASETKAGIIRIATQEEALNGTLDTLAVTPLKAKYIVNEYSGKVVQLGFNGVLENDILTFTPDQEPYEVKEGYEYEVDLLFPAAGVLPDDTKMVISNGTNTIQILNVKHADANSSMTYGAMKQMCRYDAEIGWRWVFNARYAITDTGIKVLVVPSAVIDDSNYVTTNTNQNISASKNFINNVTATSPDSHTGMSLCLQNSQADLTSNTMNEDGSVDFKYQGLRVVDKNGEEISFLYSAPDGVGGSFTRLGTSAKVDGVYKDGFLEVEVDANGKAHVYLPEVDTDSTVSSTQGATVGYVKDNFVTLDTTQTISASKVFTAEQQRKSTSIDITTTAESYTANNAFGFFDVNGKDMGHLENSVSTDGIHTSVMAKNSDSYQATVGVVVPQSGTTGAYGIAPTSPIADNRNSIATTKWVNQKHQLVSALPASKNSNVFYYIPE